jgi:hypothetical protein
MERTKLPGETPAPTPLPAEAVQSDGKIWFKKIGGGSLRLNGKIIKPNEKFRARPSDISKSFRDVCIPLEKLDAVTDSPTPVKAVKSMYQVVPRGKSKTLFDVVLQTGTDENGEPVFAPPINEKALPRQIAENLKKDLEK